MYEVVYTGNENFPSSIPQIHLEKEKCLLLLDVYVKRRDVGFENSVYQKPTFTGQYLHWESFSPLKRKISLISILVHQALIFAPSVDSREK